MKLKFQIIDKSQTGFARYCPSFAHAHSALVEGITKMRIKLYSTMLNGPNGRLEVRWLALHPLIRLASKEKSRERTIAILADALKHPNPSARYCAAVALFGAVERGADISVAVPGLADAFKYPHINVWINTIAALSKAATKQVVVDALVDALSSPHANAREFAAKHLANEARKGTNLNYDEDKLASAIESECLKLRNTDNSSVHIVIISYLADVVANLPDNAKTAGVVLDLFLNSKTPFSEFDVARMKLLTALTAKKFDFSLAVPHLVSALNNDYERVRTSACSALLSISKGKSEESKKTLTTEINKLLHSSKFLFETENYSRAFLNIILVCAEAMANIQKHEIAVLEASV